MVYFEFLSQIGIGVIFVVSILVLMDGVLRVGGKAADCPGDGVSILVLMDGVLRGGHFRPQEASRIRFNPCSNGWCTSRKPFAPGTDNLVTFQSLF